MLTVLPTAGYADGAGSRARFDFHQPSGANGIMTVMILPPRGLALAGGKTLFVTSADAVLRVDLH